MALTYQEAKRRVRPWGFETRVAIWKDGNHVETFTTHWQPNEGTPTEEQISERIDARLVKIQARLDWLAKQSTVFDEYGPEIKEAVFWLIRKIRQYPGVTLTQAETAWNDEWADSLFTWDRMVAWVRARAGNITWDQFKTYVIDHTFEGVD